MTRVEHIGPHTLYLGDCREILPTLGRVDAVVTDPPYGVFAGREGGGFMKKAASVLLRSEAEKWDVRAAGDAIRASRDAADKWIIWGGNYFASDLGDTPGLLVWNKLTGANLYADGELAFTNTTRTMRIFTHQWCGAFKASERGVVSEHPTQKPIELMQWCIEQLPSDASTILDPFMGSGTTGVACQKLGRKFIGVEIERKYFDIACKRIDDAMKQGDLFIEPPKAQAVQETLL